MDDIYGDLENYNDVNALDELRNENNQLKFRVKEYASELEKLQKEYDKLSSEFKKLEINYSSLLKTSKAEIERKTQIICNLNSEKDIMVLNSIQNSNKCIMNIRRNLLRDKKRNHNLKKLKKDTDMDCSKKNRKDLRESKKLDLEKERKDERRVSSVDTVTSKSTDDCTENKLGKLDVYHEKNSDSKENITKAKPRAQSIRNRRKSMPVLGKHLPKFSSDEENDDNTADESKKKDWYSRDEKSRRNPERNYNEKVIHKISETSGIDEKYSSYHESSRETSYKSKPNRQNDKHRSMRDKYEQTQRPRRHLSPERSHRKAPREHSNEYYQRSDYGRYRVLESPPLDRFEVQQRNRRFKIDHQFEDNHRPRYEKHLVHVKHKLSSDNEEPSRKRPRTHSSSRNLEDEKNRNKHLGLAENAIPSRIIEPLRLTSCQSPDYIDLETVEPVKEIMSTAEIKLEDPRLKSQKYITQHADETIPCTVSGRNVDLKAIDSSTWEIERVDIPEALKRPPNYTDEIVQQLYKDVEKPVSNMTPESGEIQSDNELDSYFSTMYDQENQRVKDLNMHELYEKKSKDFDTRKSHGVSNNNTDANQTCDRMKQLYQPLTEYVIDKAKQGNKSDTKITIKLSKKETDSSNKQRKSGNKTREQTQHSGDKKVLSYREIVEGDLALSDETSDIDAQIKIKDKCKTRSQHLCLENRKYNNSKEKCNKSEEETLSNTNQEEKAEELLAKITKKSKSKKSHKCKDKSCYSKNTEDTTIEHTTDRQNKLKIENQNTEQIKEKLTDLFGDSSSLITPEDLVIISENPTNKFNLLFEDALDANDITVKEIAQPQKDSEKKTDEPTAVKEEVKHKLKTKEKKKKSKKNDEKRSSVDTQGEEKDKETDNINCQAVTSEPDVVRTVIISSGIQLQIPPEENIKSVVDQQANLNVIKEVDHVQVTEVLTNLEQLQPSALATSTPYKELPIKNVIPEPDPRMVESSCYYDSRMLRNETATPSDLSSNMDMNSQTEPDAPDVRIFVRRRKKVLKKTALTS